MSATNAFEAQVIALFFNGTAISGLAENDSSSPITEYFVSLHTSDPGETGSQNTGETTYTGYSRLSVSRDSSGFTCSGSSAVNTEQLTFGQCSADAGSSVTYVGLGYDESGAGTLINRLPLENPIVIAIGSTPIFPAGDLDFTAE